MDEALKSAIKEMEAAEKRAHNSYVRLIRAVHATLTEAYNSGDWGYVFEVRQALGTLLNSDSFEITKAS